MTPEVETLIAGCKTVAAKIRALDTAGYPRAEIARLLGKRYQHVRNVLEEPAKPSATVVAQEGMADGGASAFVHDRPKTYRLQVKNGTVTLPPEVLKALNTGPNSVIIADLGEDSFTLLSSLTALKRVQDFLAPYWTPGVSVVDEFLAEKWEEAEREDREDRRDD